MTSFLTFSVLRQPKMSVIGNFIVMSLFVNELSSNFAKDVKIRSLFIPIALKLILFIIAAANEKL